MAYWHHCKWHNMFWQVQEFLQAFNAFFKGMYPQPYRAQSFGSGGQEQVYSLFFFFW